MVRGSCRRVGERFLSQAIDALAKIEKYPRRFARTKHQTGREIRRRMFAHFPYSIIYEVTAAECVVIAVAHVARKPGYWRDRLQ